MDPIHKTHQGLFQPVHEKYRPLLIDENLIRVHIGGKERASTGFPSLFGAPSLPFESKGPHIR